jgi:hypothetical protein
VLWAAGNALHRISSRLFSLLDIALAPPVDFNWLVNISTNALKKRLHSISAYMSHLLTSSARLPNSVSVLLLSAFASIHVLASFKLSVLYAIVEVQHTANRE